MYFASAVLISFTGYQAQSNNHPIDFNMEECKVQTAEQLIEAPKEAEPENPSPKVKQASAQQKAVEEPPTEPKNYLREYLDTLTPQESSCVMAYIIDRGYIIENKQHLLYDRVLIEGLLQLAIDYASKSRQCIALSEVGEL